MKYNVEASVGTKVVSREYEALMPGEAMRLFWEEVAIPNGLRGIYRCSQVPTAPKPEQIPYNSGLVSDLVVDMSNLKAELEWQPVYCVRPKWEIYCSSCGSKMAERWGKYGQFFVCDCGKTLSAKSADVASSARVIYFCSQRKVAQLNSRGVPYDACPKCNKEKDLSKK